MSAAFQVAPILFLPAPGPSPVEALLAGAHWAIAQDVLERASQAGLASATLATNWREAAEEMGRWGRVFLDSEEFHFGHRLREIIHQFQFSHPIYLGRGYGALMPVETLASIALTLSRSPHTVITNNYYSSDLIAFTPGRAIEAISPPTNDNALAWLLVNEASLRLVSLPRSAATLFDVDSPSDLWVLNLHRGAGPHTRAYLEAADLDTSRLTPLLKVLADPQGEVVVAGRVSSFVWSRLEEATACRVRVFSEERGMRANGREEAGAVRSILGFYLEQGGPRRFFQDLAQLGQGAILDSRVIFHHLGLRPSAADRFYSDLGWPHLIQDRAVREFTEAALQAPIPIILGGHSMVSGGLLALLEAAGLQKPPPHPSSPLEAI